MTFFKEVGALDYLAFGAAAFLVVRGFMRGCSGELGRLVATLAAAAFGYFGFRGVARLVLTAKLFGDNPYAGRLVAFILMAVLCIAVWLFLRHVLADGLRLVIAQPFDAMLGGMIGGIKAFVGVAVLCTLGLLGPKESDRARFKEQSLTAQKLAPLLKNLTSPDR